MVQIGSHPRSADGGAATEIGAVVEKLIARHLLPSLSCGQGAVTVKGQERTFQDRAMVGLDDLFVQEARFFFLGVQRAEQSVEPRPFDLVGIFCLSRQEEQARAEFHPGNGYAGLLHHTVVMRGLSGFGVVEQFMRAPAGTDDGHLGFRNGFPEVHRHFPIPFVACDQIVFNDPFKAGDHFIRLGIAVLIRHFSIFQCQFENVDPLGSALFDDVSCEIEIPFLSGQFVKPYHRFEDRRGIDAFPFMRIGDPHFAFPVSDVP